MPWLILILGGVLGVLLFFGKKTDCDNEGIVALTVFLVIAMVIGVVLWPVMYARTTATIAELEAFQENVFETYIFTVDATEKAVVKLDLDKLVVSAENLKQSTNLSDRIAELRDKLVWYNETLKRFKALNKIWWLDAFIKDVPESLKTIKLTAGDLGSKTK